VSESAAADDREPAGEILSAAKDLMTDEIQQTAATSAVPPKPRMSTRNRLLFYAVAWFIVLLPFLFWRSTWFGRPLSDSQISEYLRDESKPRQIQHALVQIGERMARGDKSAAQWYPEMARLATHRVEEIRTTDAWLMGQDTSYPQFRETLKTMLADASPLVRSNAALSLVRFGDDSGHDQIVAMLQPTVATAPRAGRVTALAKPGEPINHGTMLARIAAASEEVEVRAPITGRIRSVAAREGAEVAAGAELAVIEPGTEQVWEALRALYLIGRMEDIPAIQPFQRDTPSYPARVVQQAKATEQAIRARSSN
jgi:biotin carboxyl carrier protein